MILDTKASSIIMDPYFGYTTIVAHGTTTAGWVNILSQNYLKETSSANSDTHMFGR